MKKQIIILALAIGALSILINAQEGKPPAGAPGEGGQRPPRGEGRPPGEGRPEGEGRPGGQGGGSGGQRPLSPIIEALDLNKDGTIDADELAKAAESLKKLDKNGDGKITEDEYRPQRPGGGQGGPGGPGQGRPPGGGPGAPGGEGRPQRPPAGQ